MESEEDGMQGTFFEEGTIKVKSSLLPVEPPEQSDYDLRRAIIAAREQNKTCAPLGTGTTQLYGPRFNPTDESSRMQSGVRMRRY